MKPWILLSSSTSILSMQFYCQFFQRVPWTWPSYSQISWWYHFSYCFKKEPRKKWLKALILNYKTQMFHYGKWIFMNNYHRSKVVPWLIMIKVVINHMVWWTIYFLLLLHQHRLLFISIRLSLTCLIMAMLMICSNILIGY